jgi:hypothetical protein
MKRLSWILLFLTATAHGQTFNDGGAHVLKGSATSAQVSNATTLTIEAPAAVSAGVQVDGHSTLNLLGGTVAGTDSPANYTTGQTAISSIGLFTASGGAVTGGNATGVGGAGGIGLLSQGTTRISDGSFLGGSGTQLGGYGLSTSLQGLDLSGGLFQGGAGARMGSGVFVNGASLDRGLISGGAFDGYYSLIFNGFGHSDLEITGGTFQNGLFLTLYDESSVDFRGSDFSFDSRSKLLTGQLDDGTHLSTTINSFFPYSIHRSAGSIRFSAIDFVSVPEPSSWILLTAGLTTAMAQAWRIRRA